LEAGSWKLEFGSWNLEAGIWKLEFGSWSLEFGGIGAQIAIVRSLEIRIQYSHLTNLFIFILIPLLFLE
jgi:hypothetical protein